MKKTVITFGIIGGILVAGLMYLTGPFGKDKIDFENGEVMGYVSMVIALSTIFFGIKTLRDKHLGGSISFKKAFLTGFYITLIASVIYALGWEIYFRNYASDFMSQYTGFLLDKMKAEGASAAEIQAKATEMQNMAEAYKNPLIRFGFTLIEILPVGLLISLISAAILRKKENVTTATI